MILHKLKTLIFKILTYFFIYTSSFFNPLRIHLRLLTILKTSSKTVGRNMFLICKYIYFESLFNRLYIEIKQMLK